jgi:dTDP-N-acetylfucosamine:lipid II N-acetylfucosaminyltransferase
MTKKILHLANLDKFIPGFIEIVRQYFPDDSQAIVTFGHMDKYPYHQTANTLHFATRRDIKGLFKLMLALHSHDKIILHGLFMHQLTIFLCFMPWLHKKCIWAIWGGDLYYHQSAVKNTRYRIIDFFRKILISRLGGLITYVDGDYQNAQQWYGAKGQRYDCIMYKSNIYSGGELVEAELAEKYADINYKVNVLIGNSADPTNSHQQVFEKLAKLDVENRISKIYCPLSYGNPDYAKDIKLLGEMIFGSQFHPLMDFMPLAQYNKILDEVDIAIFAHNRQQAMGNTINLLGRGKAVYMRADVSSYRLLTKLGISVFTLDSLELEPQSVNIAISNHNIVSDYFSEKNLVKGLGEIFH